MSKATQDRYSITDIDFAVLEDWLEDRLHDLHTAHPAVVDSIEDVNNTREINAFNGSERTVNVRLTIQRDIRGINHAITPLINVPILYPASKSFGMVWPIKKGDEGLVVFSERSIDRWWSKEGGNIIVNPRDIRMHHYSDGFFIPHVMRRETARDCPPIEDDTLCLYSGSNQETKIKLKNDGTFCVETKNGEFLDVLTETLELISNSLTPPNPAVQILVDKIKGMIC